MTEFFFLRLQIFLSRFGRWNFDRHALDDLQSCFLQSPQFSRIVRDYFDLAQAEIEKDFGALRVLARIYRQSEPLVGFDSVRTLVLQGVGANLIENPNAAPFLLLVDNRATSFCFDHLHCAMKLRPAIAFRGSKYVPGQALRMDAHQSRSIASELAFEERNELFVAVKRAITRNLEVAPFGR